MDSLTVLDVPRPPPPDGRPPRAAGPPLWRVRAWARDNGYAVADRGLLPRGVVADYCEAVPDWRYLPGERPTGGLAEGVPVRLTASVPPEGDGPETPRCPVDGCSTQRRQGRIPRGWYEVVRTGHPTRIFCSLRCLVAYYAGVFDRRPVPEPARPMLSLTEALAVVNGYARAQLTPQSLTVARVRHVCRLAHAALTAGDDPLDRARLARLAAARGRLMAEVDGGVADPDRAPGDPEAALDVEAADSLSPSATKPSEWAGDATEEVG